MGWDVVFFHSSNSGRMWTLAEKTLGKPHQRDDADWQSVARDSIRLSTVDSHQHAPVLFPNATSRPDTEDNTCMHRKSQWNWHHESCQKPRAKTCSSGQQTKLQLAMLWKERQDTQEYASVNEAAWWPHGCFMLFQEQIHSSIECHQHVPMIFPTSSKYFFLGASFFNMLQQKSVDDPHLPISPSSHCPMAELLGVSWTTNWTVSLPWHSIPATWRSNAQQWKLSSFCRTAIWWYIYI